MAERLSRIIGTEEDKVNCPFYFKIGACRHGDGCSRTHLRPRFSQTLLIPHLYIPPPPTADGQVVDDTEKFEDFFEEIYDELCKFGEVEQLNVVENLGDHLFGNVYVKYHYEEDAEKCLKAMAGRYYAGRLVAPEYSPVTDFSEARCRQFDESNCLRGGYCNFMHLKRVPRHLRKLMRSSTRKKDRGGDKGRGGGDRERGGGSGGSGRDRERRSGRERSRRDRSGSRDKERSRRDRSRSPKKGEEDRSMARSGSEERRAKIAQWNKAREDPPAEAEAEGEAAAAPPADAEAAEAAPPADAAAPPAEAPPAPAAE